MRAERRDTASVENAASVNCSEEPKRRERAWMGEHPERHRDLAAARGRVRHLTDIAKEIEWNPRTRRVEKPTSGPIGPGTRFGAEWIKGNPAIVEYVTFERSTAWTSIARSRRLDATGEGRISLTEHGSRVVIRTQLRPKGLLALLLPVMRRTMHAREDQNLERSRRSWREGDLDRRACPCVSPRPGPKGNGR